MPLPSLPHWLLRLLLLSLLCLLLPPPASSVGHGHTVLNTQSRNQIDVAEFTQFCELGFMIRENPEELEDTEECAVTVPGEFSHDEDLPVLFMLILICSWGAFVRAIGTHFHIKIPYTVMLLVSGAILGGFSHIEKFCPLISKYSAVARLSPKHILYTFLPILIFESAFNIPVHIFIRSFAQIFILAFPGMALSTFGTAYICWQFFSKYHWTFLEACLFGCIVSATDPVAVVAILRDLGVSEQLSVLIDGESLMNDGVAILMFELFHEFVAEAEEFHSKTITDITLHVLAKFAQISIGGPLWGWFTGRVVIFLLSYVYNDATVEISATLCVSYLTYWSSEYLMGVSGVMAVVALGLTMSAERTVISPESEGPVHHFWEMSGYLANTVLFVLVGIVISETAILHFEPVDFQYLFLLYIGLHVVRLLMLLIFSPILQRLGYGLSWENMIVIMWGGLRGAVGICLALEIYQDEHLCSLTNMGPKFLFHTAGIVVLTLCINGTSTKALLQTLRLTEVTVGQREEMNNAVRRIRKHKYNMIRSFQITPWMADARWDMVLKICQVENPYELPDRFDPAKQKDPNIIIPPRPIRDNTTVCWNCNSVVENEPTVAEYREMTNDARLRAIKSMKIHYLHLFEQGTLTEQATQLLLRDAEKAEDKYLSVIQAQNFHKYMQAHGFWVWLRDKIIIAFKLHKEEELPEVPAEQWRQLFFYIVTRDWFEVLSFTMIAFNMVTVIWDVALIFTSEHPHNQCVWTPAERRTKIAFQTTNYVFAAFYTTEAVMKLIGLGFRGYFCNPWNYLDVLVLGVTYADVYLYMLALDTEHCKKEALQSNVREYLGIFKGLRVLQFIRSLRLLRPLVPRILRKIRRQTNFQVFIGYDMGKGFVETSDAVIKFIPQIAENKKVQHVIKQAMKRERNVCSKDLALIHSKFPGVAVALKTRHACRAVLNQMQFTLNEVRNGGLLDDPDCALLKHMLEEKMKRLVHSPTYIQPHKEIEEHVYTDIEDEGKKSMGPDSVIRPSIVSHFPKAKKSQNQKSVQSNPSNENNV